MEEVDSAHCNWREHWAATPSTSSSLNNIYFVYCLQQLHCRRNWNTTLMGGVKAAKPWNLFCQILHDPADIWLFFSPSFMQQEQQEQQPHHGVPASLTRNRRCSTDKMITPTGMDAVHVGRLERSCHTAFIDSGTLFVWGGYQVSFYLFRYICTVNNHFETFHPQCFSSGNIIWFIHLMLVFTKVLQRIPPMWRRHTGFCSCLT